jgi:hypothetical protein
MSATATAPIITRVVRCRLCGCQLAEWDNFDRRLCASCADRPEVKGQPPAKSVSLAAPVPPRPPARAFTPAEKGLIKSLHGALPVGELLRILNDRMRADLGPHATPYDIEQLHAELQAIAPAPTQDAGWAGLRRILGEARRSGVLGTITPQTIDDFAAVFQLAPAQLLHLKDVLAHAKEGQ